MNSIFSTSRSNRATRSKSRRSAEEQEALEICLGERFYPLRIRKLKQARSIAVSVDVVKGEVRLSMPRFASTAEALRFAQSKSDWLLQRFEEALPAIPLVDGAQIAFAGETHLVHWSSDFPRKPSLADGEIQVGGPRDRVAARLMSWMKDEARRIFAEDLAYYCARAEVPVPVLSVGDARRRWGSCSGGEKAGRRSIRLNWRLVMAPPAVRRSVVAHEVAHIRHMNHSPDFYGFLDSVFDGDRKAADRWLKEHGSALHLVGA